MKALLRVLFGIDESVGQMVSWEWAFRTAWPVGLVLLLAAGIALLAASRIRRETQRKSRPRAAILMALRLAVLLLIALLFARPTLIAGMEREEKPLAVILLDASRSMGFGDQTDGGAASSRWDSALAAVRDNLPDAFRDARDVRLAVFSATPGEERPLDQVAWAELAPTGDGTDIGSALTQALENARGRPLRQVIVVSDGRQTSGANPLEAAARFAAEGVRVDCLGAGSDRVRNIRVLPVLAERYAFSNDPVTFEVQVAASGYRNAVVPVLLSVDGREVDRASATLGDDTSEATVRLTFTPESAGLLNCRFEIPVQEGEIFGEDNVQEHALEVLAERMRVLYVEQEPRWEYRFLKNALLRDNRVRPSILLRVANRSGIPAAGEFLSVFPETQEELREFDLVILGDLPRDAFSVEQFAWLKDYVLEDGGSVLFQPGPLHLLPFEGTPLEDLMPVRGDAFRAVSIRDESVLRDLYTPAVTPLGSRHPILSAFRPESGWGSPLEDLPGFYWHLPIRETRPGAMVLAEHPAGRDDGGTDPLVVFQYIGRGRVAHVGFDETWRWRFRYGNRFYYRFWGNTIQYLAMPHLLGKRDLVQFDVAPRLSVGEEADVTVRVLTESGAPLESESQRLIAETETGPGRSATLFPVTGQPGLYRGTIRILEPGRTRFLLADHPDQESAEALAEVSPVELRDPQPNPTLLRRLAAVGNGTYVPVSEAASLFAQSAIEPVRTRWVVEKSLWEQPAFLILLALLLTVEWVARRLWGLL